MSPVKEALFERLWTTLFEGCTPAEQEVMLRVLEQVFERAGDICFNGISIADFRINGGAVYWATLPRSSSFGIDAL